jgi:Uma2 family endonuclease
MSTTAKKLMTVDEFLAWAEGQDGRWEIHNGVPYQMAAERTRHGLVKFAAQTALVRGIRSAGLDCRMQPDGAVVRVSNSTASEPDALVYCGPKLPGDAIEVPNPVIVAEVSSPSTARIDASWKLAGYFQVASVQHYLMIEPDGGPVIHHRRQGDGTILTRIITAGEIVLDPPGITVTFEELFG